MTNYICEHVGNGWDTKDIFHTGGDDSGWNPSTKQYRLIDNDTDMTMADHGLSTPHTPPASLLAYFPNYPNGTKDQAKDLGGSAEWETTGF